jgi:hypothetical protein
METFLSLGWYLFIALLFFWVGFSTAFISGTEARNNLQKRINELEEELFKALEDNEF